MALLLAQLSDLHLDGGERATERTARVMEYLRSLPRAPDALLVTGDIADHGAESEYREAAALLKAPFPVLCCPGNHDDRAAYLRFLLDEPPADGPVNRSYRMGDAVVLMCDATIPGRNEGRLDDETLDWIATTLGGLGEEVPALLAFHQPPVALGHALPDSSRLEAGQRLVELLADHPRVAGLLTGHAHTPAASSFAGVPVVVAPAVTWTLRMPWEGPSVADRDAPPGVAFHLLDADHRLTTHFRVVV
ncbi:metallophosphoesterase [Streptomyces sedi]|uniref:Phosphodiesterase n=1 Tax=Streptomyces sedi TaxID=555059 RepID=A0A5C4V2F0_9ACTN|nr:metallophosphoesterase [Streptomyces sedi]TNM29937.1 phosphodiesterase [Streptomyces sedi]